MLDGLLGIGGRPGLPPAAAAVVRGGARRRRWSSRSTCPAAPTRRRRGSAPSTVFADVTVTFGDGQAGAPAAGDRGRRSGVLDRRRHRPRAVAPAPAVQRLTPRRRGRAVAGARTGRRQVLPRRARRRRRRARPTPARRCSASPRAVAAGAGMVRYVGPPTPTALVRAAVPEAVHGAGRVQAWVVGPGPRPRRRAAARPGRSAARAEALASGVPCVVDAGGARAARARDPRRRRPCSPRTPASWPGC